MVRYIILGRKGFIGAEFSKQVIDHDCEYLLLDREFIEIFVGGKNETHPRSDSGIWHDVHKFINEKTVIVNCLWSRIDNSLEDSISHLSSEKAEINFVQKLRQVNCKYVSFGSIKEYESNSMYASSKRNVYNFVSTKLENYYWVRIANCYGSTNTGRLIDQIFQSFLSGNSFVLNNPEKIINIYPVQQFVNFCINDIFNLPSGDYNVSSQQWVKLEDLNNSFVNLTEPDYLKIDSGPFSITDSKLLRIKSPLLTDFFRALKLNQL